MAVETPSLTRIGDLTEEGTSRTIEAGGMTIHYHDIGAGDPVFMMHSYGLGTTAWITFFKVFPEFAKHFRCIALDLPNFARTGPVVYDEPTHIFQAKTARALMDALGIETAHMVGNSQGGQSSMVFAYMYPDRVRKLVWGAGHIGTAGGYTGEYTFTVTPEASSIVNREAGENPTPDNIRRYLRMHIRDEALVTDELVDYIREAYTGRADLAEARAKSRGEPYNHLTEMMTIMAPTLMVWGRYDRTCNFEIGFNALNHIRNSRLVVLHCGHWVPFEKPREYASHVLSFLNADWA
jgi:2-hydroxy-6-oxonona-2,4-dienedioate hydrolase